MMPAHSAGIIIYIPPMYTIGNQIVYSKVLNT